MGFFHLRKSESPLILQKKKNLPCLWLHYGLLRLLWVETLITFVFDGFLYHCWMIQNGENGKMHLLFHSEVPMPKYDVSWWFLDCWDFFHRLNIVIVPDMSNTWGVTAFTFDELSTGIINTHHPTREWDQEYNIQCQQLFWRLLKCFVF